jgi:carbonic anhydrase
MISAQEALQSLREGNGRFVAGASGHGDLSSHERRSELVEGQKPIAIILGCSDSRAPVELIFDQGLGDLFVIRVAGNIVAPSQVGSIEFAAAEFGVQLVLVLGHSHCGAINATIEEVKEPGQSNSKNLEFIVNRVRPSVEPYVDQLSGPELTARAVTANVHSSVEQIRHGSKIVEQLISAGKLSIVGAEYSLDTGIVSFHED